jgi:hypothetical protein
VGANHCKCNWDWLNVPSEAVLELINFGRPSGADQSCLASARTADHRAHKSKNYLIFYFNFPALKDFKPIHVDLSENNIENITVLADLPIETLNLSRCGVEFIENASFRDLQQMKVLDLSHNKLTSKLSPHVFEVNIFTTFRAVKPQN